MRRTRVTAEQRHREAVLLRDGPVCIGCGQAFDPSELHAHHFVSRQTIRTRRDAALVALAHGKSLGPGRRRLTDRSLEDLIADPRNGGMVCERCHSKPWKLTEPSHAMEFRLDYDF